MGKGKLWLLLVIVGLILAACAPKATPVAPMPVEATPTLSPAAILGPQPGATFSGPIEISGKASSGTISFTISDDGDSITSVSVLLSDLECDGMSAGSMETRASGPFPVTDGELAASPSNLGEIEGQFTSSTEAVGTINLRLEFSVLDQKIVCELGTWGWSAEVH